MSEENKTIARRFSEEAWGGNLNVVDELFSPEVVFTGRRGSHRGIEGIKQAKELITLYRTAFPDLQCTIEDQITEGDEVATRMTWRGTHLGEFLGIAPTGKRVDWSVIEILNISDGNIVERWVAANGVSMQQQLSTMLQS